MSWLQTCCVTQLPIDYGDECHVLMTIERGSARYQPSQITYSTDEWTPISFPIPAEYNDHGCLSARDEDNWALQKVADTLGDRLNSMPEDPSLKDLTDRYNLSDELFIKEYTDGTRVEGRVGFNVVREDIYQLMTEPHEEIYREDSPSERIEKALENEKDYFTFPSIRNVLCGQDLLFLDDVSWPQEDPRPPGANFQPDELPDNFPELAEDLCTFVVHMNMLRKKFGTQSGGGSQCQTRPIHEGIYSYVTEQI